MLFAIAKHHAGFAVSTSAIPQELNILLVPNVSVCFREKVQLLHSFPDYVLALYAEGLFVGSIEV